MSWPAVHGLAVLLGCAGRLPQQRGGVQPGPAHLPAHAHAALGAGLLRGALPLGRLPGSRREPQRRWCACPRVTSGRMGALRVAGCLVLTTVLSILEVWSHVTQLSISLELGRRKKK